MSTQLQESRKRAQELEHHIQNDKRREELEASLLKVQDRAESLEFEVSRLRQVSCARCDIIFNDLSNPV